MLTQRQVALFTVFLIVHFHSCLSGCPLINSFSNYQQMLLFLLLFRAPFSPYKDDCICVERQCQWVLLLTTLQKWHQHCRQLHKRATQHKFTYLLLNSTRRKFLFACCPRGATFILPPLTLFFSFKTADQDFVISA